MIAAAIAAVVVVACSGANGTPDGPPPSKKNGTTPPAPTSTATGDPSSTNDPTNPPPPTNAKCTGKTGQPLDSTWTLPFHGEDRTFQVHVPASYDPIKPTPLVMNFHGYSSDAAQEELLSRMIDKSNAEGFVTVHAQGHANSWNAGACCGDAAAKGIDDVGFVSAMLDALEEKLCVDAKRVFATGMSNGGFLSHRLACDLSDRIAAVAPVAGVLGIAECHPKRAVPVMHFHGTADSLVPYDGSASLGFPAVQKTFADWATRDGCIGTPIESFKNVDAHCSTYSSCSGGAEVTLCTVDGGGHTWPGGTPIPSLGYTTPWLSATDRMWSFFVAHPMP